MIYIDKNQAVSQRGRLVIQEWLDSKKDEDNDGHDRTHQEYLDLLYDDNKKSGESIWKIMIDKRPLKHILLCEQGFVCCYCGRRVFLDHNTLLEHLAAKGAKDTNGIYVNKRLVFNYDNLMACCFGSSKDILHIIAGSEETVESVAKYYVISKDKIEELNVNDKNYTALKKKYDINNLKIGDKVLIIQKNEKEHQHCGPIKDDDTISIHPLQADCEEHFKYRQQGGEEVILIPLIENDAHAQKVIDRLGLNNNGVLNRDRKEAFDVALGVRNSILNSSYPNVDKRALIQRQIQSYLPNIKHAPAENYPNANFFKKAFWFVELAVFTGKIML